MSQGLTGSTQRRARAPHAGKPGRCSWCGTAELENGRRSWCSQACVDQYKIRSDPGYIRQLVRQRDRGICAVCGCDADLEYRRWCGIRREVRRLAERLVYLYRFNTHLVQGRVEFRNRDMVPDWREIEKFTEGLLDRYCPTRWTGGRTTGWDADHIVPVAEGGGECDLANYRTLCHPCHKQSTKELAGRLAQKRKSKQETK